MHARTYARATICASIKRISRAQAGQPSEPWLSPGAQSGPSRSIEAGPTGPTDPNGQAPQGRRATRASWAELTDAGGRVM